MGNVFYKYNIYFKTMNSIYICTLQKKNNLNQKSQRCSVAYWYLDTEYAMGAAPIIYSVSRY